MEKPPFGGSVIARKHDGEHVCCLSGILGVFRSKFHSRIVVVDFPEDLAAFHQYRTEGACQESCVEGRLQLNPLLCSEPFAEDDGELCLCGGPLAWRHFPLSADLAQHQEQ